MPKGSPELTEARREEIINACEKLYQTMSFKEITIKEIGNVTSFTRTSIYNYFQTKDEFADMLARSLEKRAQLLKILSMNHYDMETSSRPEHLEDFKAVYGESLRTVMLGLNKYFPDMAVSAKQNFIYTFFPFMFGIYPYTFVTEKQRAAMERANVNYVFMTIYEITYNCVRKLLNQETENENRNY